MTVPVLLPSLLHTTAVLPMSDVTQILGQIEDGDGHAANKLLPLVYDVAAA